MQARDFAEFKAWCERSSAVPFPAASGEDALDELRAELAEYDGYAAGLLESALVGEGAGPPASATSALDLQTALERRMHDAGRAGEYARVYLEYLLEIDARLRQAAALGLIRLSPPAASD